MRPWSVTIEGSWKYSPSTLLQPNYSFKLIGGTKGRFEFGNPHKSSNAWMISVHMCPVDLERRITPIPRWSQSEWADQIDEAHVHLEQLMILPRGVAFFCYSSSVYLDTEWSRLLPNRSLPHFFKILIMACQEAITSNVHIRAFLIDVL